MGAAGGTLSALPILLSRAQRTLVEIPEVEPDLAPGPGDIAVVQPAPATPDP